MAIMKGIWISLCLFAIKCGAFEVHDCGGFAGIQCPPTLDGSKYVCVTDLCDPNTADCMGYCQVEADCSTSSTRSLSCPAELGCVDNPNDDCIPSRGDTECDEFCKFEEPCDPRGACAAQYDPVCGSDGVTYQSECYLHMVRCVNPNIVMVAHNECSDEVDNGGDVCIEIYDPVCATNGVTYDNECYWENAHKVDSSIDIVAKMSCAAWDELQAQNADANGSNGGGLNNNTKIGVTIGVVGGVIVLMTIAYLIMRRRVHSKRGHPTQLQTDSPSGTRRNTQYAEMADES